MREASEVAEMSSAAADLMFGGGTVPTGTAEPSNDFDSDMYELEKLAIAIGEALATSAHYADERYGVGRRMLMKKFVPPVRPKIEFRLGLPKWANL